MNLKGQWVWVTGASSGLGLELSKQLAKRGANLLITARRVERLEALATELRAGGVEVQVLPADMSRSEDVERILGVAKSLPLSSVVLNAGVTHFGYHHELEWPAFEAMLRTNVIGTTRLTSELVKHFQARGTDARIMLVTSLTGLLPVPFQAAYSGTKAFLSAFGMALAHELRGTKVSVTVFAPGGIATEQTAGARFDKLRAWLAPVDAVALEALAALRSRPSLYIQGFWNRVGFLLFRFMPRDLAMWLVSREYRKSLAAEAAASLAKK
jgi:short-subunit dehydrogenase